MVHLMQSAQISMAILKGTAAAIYYPNPIARTMGDVDFLVPEENFRQAYELMLKNGYELQYDEEHVDYHITLRKDDITYEIHNKPAGMPGGEAGKCLLCILEDGLKTCRMVELEGCIIPVLPALQNGIVLLLYIVKHLKSGLGLRQIIDWMMYVDQELDDEMWNTQMQPVLKKTEYEKLAKIVTRTCQIYLGLREDNIKWCLDIDEDIYQTLMSYIMTQGNFGRKKQEEDKGVKIVEAIRGPFQFFQLLQKRGENKWLLLKKYPFLRPFSWMYMGGRYIVMALQREKPFRTLISDVRGGGERKELFRQLGIYQEK